MKVQAIQTADTTAAINTETVNDVTQDFSSYLNTSSTLDEIFTEASETYGVSKDLLKAIAKAESNFDPDATSKAGAQGIMQLMPATAKSLGVTDSYDPYQNIMGGANYISQMLSKYDGNVTLALAAYNAGSGNVAKYGGVPPFTETQNYIAKIMSYLDEGVTVPEGTYTTPVQYEDSYYQSILDELFSYEDYLKFLELYMDVTDAQNTKTQKEQEEGKKSDSYYSYQEIKYNPAVLNLINNGEGI